MFAEAEKIQHKKRKIKNSSKSSGLDLLDVSFIKKLILWSGFPFFFQMLLILLLIGMIIVSWGVLPPAESSSSLFARLNIITLLAWGIWWPLMIAAIIVFGRVWCMICPLELISRMSSRAAGFLGAPRLAVKRFIKDGAVILLLYFLIQMLVSGAGLHQVPAYTSFFFTALIGLAVFSGLFYRNGSFCKYFCPVAMTLNVYSRGSMLAVRTATKKKCASCQDKNCISNENKHLLKAGSCPCSIYPPKLESNKECMLCGQCIKSCTSDNIQLLLRPPFDRNDRRENTVSFFLAAFVFIESGFVAGELAEELPAAAEIFSIAPHYFTDFLGLQSLSAWINSLWALLVFPMVFWSLLFIPLWLGSRKTGLIDLWRSYSMCIIILVAAGHLIKSLLKFSEWATFLPYALADPSGKKNLQAIESGQMFMPQPLLNHQTVLIIISFIVLSALYYFRRENRFYKTEQAGFSRI